MARAISSASMIRVAKLRQVAQPPGRQQNTHLVSGERLEFFRVHCDDNDLGLGVPAPARFHPCGVTMIPLFCR